MASWQTSIILPAASVEAVSFILSLPPPPQVPQIVGDQAQRTEAVSCPSWSASILKVLNFRSLPAAHWHVSDVGWCPKHLPFR